MTDHDRPHDNVSTPIQPTGSGVVDLELAREQDALAADGAIEGSLEDATDEDARSRSDAADIAESEGHPS